jgi:V/A-type H+-transporting ATPase subunit I
MAISKLEKVHIVVHRSQRKEVLDALQEEAILHLVEAGDASSFAELGPSGEKPEESRSGFEDLLLRIRKGITYLKNYAPKAGGLLSSLMESKLALERSEYETLTREFDPAPVVERCDALERRGSALRAESTALEGKIEQMAPWEDLDVPLEEIESTRDAVILAGTIPVRREPELESLPLSHHRVSRDQKRAYVVLAYHRSDEKDVKSGLLSMEFETSDFRGLEGIPARILVELRAKLEEVHRELARIEEDSAELAREVQKLQVAYDHALGEASKERAEEMGLRTRDTISLLGWIQAEDFKRLEDLVSRFDSALLTRIEPEKGESPPVVLENQRSIRPFELVTEMYGLPKYRGIDPTPLLAPFFAIFFAVTLTDAGYGFVLCVLAALMLWKMKTGGKLLWLFIIGGLFTIVAGALTGSWFGDIITRLPFQGLKDFRASLMLFDPMKEPIKFFYVSLALGYLQVQAGLLISVYKNIREGDLITAISKDLAWFLILLCIVLTPIVSRGAGGGLTAMLWSSLPQKVITSVILLSFLALLFVSGGKSRNPLIRLAKGGFNLYNGISFLGDLLSYVRLMALGLVTGGIAMAINVMAELIAPFPVVGYVLAVLIFIGGHLFGVAVNTLGGFVHTLRLQYVEFFTKFYEGGGATFKPFQKEKAYTTIKP